MIDFSLNTNHFGPHRLLLKMLKDNVRMFCDYPSRDGGEIKNILSTFFGVKIQNIALGVGSTQIFFDIPKMFSYKRAVVIVPTFWEYTVFNTLFKKKIQRIELSEKNNFKLDCVSIKKQ